MQKIILSEKKMTKLFKSIADYKPYLKKIDTLRQEGKIEEERALIAEVTGNWVNDIVRKFDMHLTVEGQENIPEGACAFYVNHQGYGDIPTMFKICEGKQIGFVAKDSAEKLPFISDWIKASQGVFIKRGETREGLKAIKEGAEKLKDGYSLIIFPEGTRSKSSNNLLEFHNGSFRCALKTKCTVVPVALVDCYKVLDQKGSKPVTVQIHYLPPIEYDEYREMNTKELAALVRSRVEEKVKASI